MDRVTEEIFGQRNFSRDFNATELMSENCINTASFMKLCLFIYLKKLGLNDLRSRTKHFITASSTLSNEKVQLRSQQIVSLLA